MANWTSTLLCSLLCNDPRRQQPDALYQRSDFKKATILSFRLKKAKINYNFLLTLVPNLTFSLCWNYLIKNIHSLLVYKLYLTLNNATRINQSARTRERKSSHITTVETEQWEEQDQKKCSSVKRMFFDKQTKIVTYAFGLTWLL